VKLAVVGAGSTYTPEIIDGLIAHRDSVSVSELWLCDPDAERLAVVGGLAERMLCRVEHPAAVHRTSDVSEAVRDAACVLIQIRVGGQAARIVDERAPLDCRCIGQETTGFGGLAMALRTVPAVLEIAERVRELAPGAWIVNFTNPVGIVTRALLDAGHRAIGLCNAAIVFQAHFARVLGVAPERLELDHVGLNHLTWELGVRLDGEDVLERLVGEHVDEVAPATGLDAPLVRALGTVPSYYLHYYYSHDPLVERQRHEPSRAEIVAGIEADLLRRYADERLDVRPEELSRRGGAGYSRAAVALIAALLGTSPARHVINLRNEGALPFLADQAVVEVPAQVSRDRARAVPVPQPDPLERGLIAHVSAYEELALDAARRGGRDRVFRALLAHPLIGQSELASRLTATMLAANRDFLPWA
jgi:6-phospho-beta-glucosidase